jgi:hypothetical protein
MTSLMPWLYVSTSQVDPDDSVFQVERIVRQSRIRNAELSVTGALIYSGTRFLQYIEGPPDAVASLQASILKDDRHEEITTLPLRASDERRFGRWALAFSGTSSFVDKMLDRALSRHLADDGDQILKLLKQFC